MTIVFLALYPTGPLVAAANVNADIIDQVWPALNPIDARDLLGKGRVYGGGLHKLEPKELTNVPAYAIAELLNVQPQQ